MDKMSVHNILVRPLEVDVNVQLEPVNENHRR